MHSTDLPPDCRERAASPDVLFEKLNDWGLDTLVIPHGTTWGFYTPLGYTWDKQLRADLDDANLQRLVEVFSGHGNSEEYRSFRVRQLHRRRHGVPRTHRRLRSLLLARWRGHP